MVVLNAGVPEFSVQQQEVHHFLCVVSGKGLHQENSINQSMLTVIGMIKLNPILIMTVLFDNLSVMIFLQQLKFATKPNMYIIHKKTKETLNELFMQLTGIICMS